MKRRDFLKLGSVVSALSYASVAPLGKMLSMPIETAAQGIIYRGTASGKIYTSKNGGKTWQLHTNLGKGYAVLDIFTARDGHLYTQVGSNNTISSWCRPRTGSPGHPGRSNLRPSTNHNFRRFHGKRTAAASPVLFSLCRLSHKIHDGRPLCSHTPDSIIKLE